MAHAAEGERRAQAELEQRNEEQVNEVNDLQNEVTWFRGEYDQLLKKVQLFVISELGVYFSLLKPTYQKRVL